MKRKNGSHAIIVFIDSYLLPWTLAQIFSTTTTTRISDPDVDCRDWIRFSSTTGWRYTDSRSRQQSNRAKGVLILLMNFSTMLAGFRQFITVGFIGLHQFTVQLVVCFYFMFHRSSPTFAPMFLYASYTVVFNIPVFVYSVCVSLSECCPLICCRYLFCCCSCCCFCVRNLKYG